jgi:serine/threonine-protein kinase RsbW
MNAAYVSSARLTTSSSIAKRMTFEIDEIEDIKAAVSETCTYLLKTLTPAEDSNFDIMFKLYKGMIEITLIVNAKPGGKADDMSLMMIKALVDEFKIDEKGPVVVTMVKRHKESFFG